MSTHDVPGANPANRDKLAMGCWAEHDDGSLIFVESSEGRKVVYSLFDVGADPVQEFRDAMAEDAFKVAYSWNPSAVTKTVGRKKKDDTPPPMKWTWHDKTPFPWDRVMGDFPAGVRSASAVGTITAAQRVADRLKLRAQAVSDEDYRRPRSHRTGRTMGARIKNALDALFDDGEK